MFSKGDKVYWTKGPGKIFKVTVDNIDTSELVTISYKVSSGARRKKQVSVRVLSSTKVSSTDSPESKSDETTGTPGSTSPESKSDETSLEAGDKVFWQKTPEKAFKVTFISRASNGDVTIQYKIRSGERKEKVVSFTSITPIRKTPSKTYTPPSSKGPRAMIQPNIPKGFKVPAALFFKKGGGFGRDIFNSKLLEVFSNFWTKRVPGDGWCLLHSANLLINFYNLDMHVYTHEDLRRLGRQYQSDFDNDWTIDDKTGKVVKNILVNELNNPMNLSENWASFLAKEMNCRFVIFTVQSRVDAAVTADPSIKRKARPKMDVWSFTAREVLPYKSPTYGRTFYLYNTGHYWPLIPNREVDPNELIRIWGNKTYEQIIDE